MLPPKEIVKAFYSSDFANNPEAHKQFLHPDCTLHWNSSKGYTKLHFEKISSLFMDIVNSYDSMRLQISHLLSDGDFVTARYTLFVSPIETPGEEIPMAHFITIWELKDGKLFNGHEISQLADASEACLESFSEIKH